MGDTYAVATLFDELYLLSQIIPIGCSLPKVTQVTLEFLAGHGNYE